MTFQIVNLPFISSKIPTTPAYVFYISHLLRYSRACVQTLILWTEFSCWRKCYLSNATFSTMVKSTIPKIYGRHHKLINHYEISISQIALGTFLKMIHVLYHWQDFYWTWLLVTRWVSYEKQELLPLFFFFFFFWPCYLSFSFSVLCFSFSFLCSVSCAQCSLCL